MQAAAAAVARGWWQRGPRVGDSHHIRASRKRPYLLPGPETPPGFQKLLRVFLGAEL